MISVKRSSLLLNIYLNKHGKCLVLTIYSQRSKVALGRLELWKIYLNLVTEYLQCYLDPEVTIYCEQRLFIDEQIS